jgi:hypothetical protein
MMQMMKEAITFEASCRTFVTLSPSYFMGHRVVIFNRVNLLTAGLDTIKFLPLLFQHPYLCFRACNF